MHYELVLGLARSLHFVVSLLNISIRGVTVVVKDEEVV